MIDEIRQMLAHRIEVLAGLCIQRADVAVTRSKKWTERARGLRRLSRSIREVS